MLRRSAFTLVEILIGVTISAILMTGVLVFLSGGIEKAFYLRKSTETLSNNSPIQQKQYEIALTSASKWNVVRSGSLAPYGSGIILVSTGRTLPFVFIGGTTATGYCDSMGESASETGTVQKLMIAEAMTDTGSYQDGTYRIDRERNVVLNSGNVVVWKSGVLGNTLLEWALGTDVELSHPSAILLSGSTLFIADTGNDRVLALSGWHITTVLPSSAGVASPNSLIHNGSSLIIGGVSEAVAIQDGDILRSGDTFTGSSSLPFNTAIIELSSGATLSSATGSYTIRGITPWSVTLSSSPGSSTSNIATLTGGLTGFTNTVITATGITAPTAPGQYIGTISLLNGETLLSKEAFPYFIRGDGDITTATGNTIKLLQSGHTLAHLDASGVLSSFPLPNPTISAASIPFSQFTLSEQPIRDLTWNDTGNILTISWKEYMRYDCKNGEHELRERIIKLPK